VNFSGDRAWVKEALKQSLSFGLSCQISSLACVSNAPCRSLDFVAISCIGINPVNVLSRQMSPYPSRFAWKFKAPELTL